MKKLVILSCLAVVIFLNAHQGFSQSIRIGLKGGISSVNQKFVSDDLTYKPDGKVRPHLGVFANIKPNDQFGFQPELLFTVQGYGRNTVSFPEDGINFIYLTVPLMAKYYFGPLVNIHAGPQLGYIIGGDSINGVSVKEDANKAEVAFAFGVECYLIEKLGLSARYVAGLTNVYNGIGAEDLTVKNRSLQFSLLLPLN